MNKKMLLVVLIPFAMHASMADVRKDVGEQFDFFIRLANKPFGNQHPDLNKVAAAVNHDLIQRAVKKYVTAVDAKVLGKTLVNAKGVMLSTGDVLSFAAAVAVSCVNDRINQSEYGNVQNAVNHIATRLTVVGLDKAYDAVAPKVASLVGVETLGFDAAINEALPEEAAALVNYARTTLVRAAVYGVVHKAISGATEGFFKP